MDCQAGTKKSPTCMGVLDEAFRLEREGKRVIHLEKGELDMDTPEPIKERVIAAVRENRTRYCDSAGLPELRRAICDHHRSEYGVEVDPSQVIVNSGSSPAMLELFIGALSPGDEVLLPDPCYPAYPSLVEAARGRVVWVRTAASGFEFTADLARPHVTPRTKAVLINFPSNPVGALAGADELRAFADLGLLVVSDDVYHGLTYDGTRPHSILEFTRNAIVVGSFSKAFAMTGWRLGYVIVPEPMAEDMLRLHQYLFVGSNTFVQWAAIAALEHQADIKRQLREELHRRRDCMLDTLDSLGFEVPYQPRGGFYVFAQPPPTGRTSGEFAADLLSHAHVAITPGTEFGPGGEGYVRFSLSSPCELIHEARGRIEAFLGNGAAGNAWETALETVGGSTCG